MALRFGSVRRHPACHEPVVAPILTAPIPIAVLVICLLLRLVVVTNAAASREVPAAAALLLAVHGRRVEASGHVPRAPAVLPLGLRLFEAAVELCTSETVGASEWLAAEFELAALAASPHSARSASCFAERLASFSIE
eukprot:CAMPEP_0205938860 /NCGR_PEP_ID=MMETSP1325-20131115/48074_1 /ASSEMBLY_ACC=CAM_ASM_000708 /TAXON_ID=236786 /ORGANISM="Florenciella sp., Strain RCC1007" /LENGTH=137 /DNA_ID=CAMNT_0053309251 /DNA_START=123 /DNA_END=534 /DNA_ORIENTATION=-